MTLENPNQRSTIAVPRHLEQLLAHAEAQLAVTGMPHSGKPDELVEAFGISARHISTAVREIA